MQITVKQLENEVRQLSAEDLRKVRQLIDSLLENKFTQPSITEEEFLRELEAEGLISRTPQATGDLLYSDSYKPVTVTGEPISEMIIRERR